MSPCCFPLFFQPDKNTVFFSQKDFPICRATPQLPCLRGSRHQVTPVSLFSSTLVKMTWNTQVFFMYFSLRFPHPCLHSHRCSFGVQWNGSFLKSYVEQFPSQILLKTWKASWSQQMGMIALSEVQPMHLQSFVSTSLSMVTSRGSHLKIMIQMQFSLSPESVRLLLPRSLPHLDVTPLGDTQCQCSTGHTNCTQQHNVFACVWQEPSWILKF